MVLINDWIDLAFENSLEKYNNLKKDKVMLQDKVGILKADRMQLERETKNLPVLEKKTEKTLSIKLI